MNHWHHVPGVILLASALVLVSGSPVITDPAPPALFTHRQTIAGSGGFLNTRFGASVAFVGEDILIGTSHVGAELFDGATGRLLQTFRPETLGGASTLGEVVADLGGNIMIAAPGGGEGGRAYLLDRADGTILQAFRNPVESERFWDSFGKSVAAIGEDILIGAPRDTALPYFPELTGAAHLFNSTGTLLRTFRDPSPTPQGGFGFVVASLNGNALITALHDTNDTSGDGGTVYLFESNTGVLLRTFSNPTSEDGDKFGWSVAVHDSQVLIGAPGDNTAGQDAGSAYLFDAGTGALLQTYTNPRPDFESIRDEFGSSVAFVGGHVLVGAPWEGGDDVGGAVYLFEKETGALRETLENPTPNHIFGWALGADGNRVLISAPGRGGPNGAAHLYMIGGIILTEQGGVTEVTEGGSVDSYELVLLIQPAAEVLITLSPTDQVTVTPGSLSFTPADWEQAKTVSVAAVDDAVEEGEHSATIEHVVSGTDLAYNGMTVPNVTVLIQDNDVLPEPARVGQDTVIILLAVVVGVWVTLALTTSLRSRKTRRRR